jgi:hypothetical protein
MIIESTKNDLLFLHLCQGPELGRRRLPERREKEELAGLRWVRINTQKQNDTE